MSTEKIILVERTTGATQELIVGNLSQLANTARAGLTIAYAKDQQGNGQRFNFFSENSGLQAVDNLVIPALGGGYWVRNTEKINAKIFGVDPSGQTENTAKMLAGLQVADQLGKPLFFENGEYDFSGWSDHIFNHKVWITCESKNTVFKNFQGRFICKEDVEVNKGTFEGANISVNNGTRWLFQVEEDGLTNSGLEVNNVIFDNVQFRDFVNGGAVGCRRESRTVIQHARINKCRFENLKHGGCVLEALVQHGSALDSFYKDLNSFPNNTALIACKFGHGVDQDCKNITVRGNTFENVKGVQSSTSGCIVCFGERVIIDGNLCYNNFPYIPSGQANEGEDTLAADTEAIYTKAKESIVTNNICIDCNYVNDGVICMKGDLDSKINTCSGNIVWQTRSVGNSNILTSARAGRITGTTNISNNIFFGLLRLNINTGHQSPHERIFNVTGNFIWKGHLSLGMQSSLRVAKVTNNVIYSAETNTSSCITQSGQATDHIVIQGNDLYTDGYIIEGLSLFSANGNLDMSGNQCYISTNNDWLGGNTIPRIANYQNNKFILNPYQNIDDPNFDNSQFRFYGDEYVKVKNNHIELPKKDAYQIRLRGKNIYFTDNTIKGNAQKPTELNILFEDRQQKTVKIDRNDFTHIYQNTALIDFQTNSNTRSILNFSCKENTFDRAGRLIRFTDSRVGKIRVQDNNFERGLDRLDANNPAIAAFSDRGHTKVSVENNEGWKTKSAGMATGYSSGNNQNHGLAHAANVVQATPAGSAIPEMYVDEINASRFRVYFSGGGTKSFFWNAEYRYADPVAPDVPVIALPAPAASGVGLTPTLKWGRADGAAAFQVRISTSAGSYGDASANLVLFDQCAFGNLVDSNANVEYQVPEGVLQPATTYYYQVKSIAGTESAWTTERSFTT